MGQTRTFPYSLCIFYVPQCDLDLQAGNIVLAHNILSCYDYYLNQIILISYNAGQSYRSDMNTFHYSLCIYFMCSSVTSTFELATQFLH